MSDATPVGGDETSPPPAAPLEPRSARQRATAGRTRSRIVAIATVTGVLLAAGGGVALALGSDSAGNYRTADAAIGSVSESLALMGTVASADLADESFGVDGTVASVDVAVGDTVAAGDTLATIDPEGLDAAVASAESALAAAEQTLADDLASQTGTVSNTSSGDTGTTGQASSSTPADPSTPASPEPEQPEESEPQQPEASDTSAEPSAVVTEATAAVTAAQDALLAAVDEAATALATTEQTIVSSDSTCSAFLDATLEPEEDAGDDTGDGAEGGGAADEAPGDDGADAALIAAQGALAECQSAIELVLAGQHEVDDAQNAIPDLAASLDDAVTALLAAYADEAMGASGGLDATSASATATTTNTTATATLATSVVTLDDPGTESNDATTGGSTTGGSTTAASAETILADRAAVDALEAELALATADLALATLTSPIAGTVAAVSLAEGDSVSAGSTDAVVKILGDTGYVVESTVTLANIDRLEVGQTADVSLASSGTDLPGTVSAIGLSDVSTDASTTSYEVTLALEPADAGTLLNGASASAVVAVETVDDAVTVPTSAVHTSGSSTTVDVFDGDVVESVEVETGAEGTDTVEIVDGIAAGDTVVLADLDAPIESGEASDGDAGSFSGLGGTGTGGTGAGRAGTGGGTPAG
ncbi:HlyD family efflux transporter periplasmic adaptor subunit [Marisediminicola sp. LYQ85]|uniref:efflux RND transporter periplasmic adaptor subunit n=1 Tax=Marisediminicola sp. LYQ85 TaxID=3391062 RepID=UPI003982DC47